MAASGLPGLPGHVWLEPYVTFEPALALAAQDPAGVGGYVLGALDSRARLLLLLSPSAKMVMNRPGPR